jgi:hypothetical protein
MSDIIRPNNAPLPLLPVLVSVPVLSNAQPSLTSFKSEKRVKHNDNDNDNNNNDDDYDDKQTIKRQKNVHHQRKINLLLTQEEIVIPSITTTFVKLEVFLLWKSSHRILS